MLNVSQEGPKQFIARVGDDGTQLRVTGPGAGEVTDGYHTFNELYDHRCVLFIAVMKYNFDVSWWSRMHHDGTEYSDYVIAGCTLPTGAVTYHMPAKFIPLLVAACVPEKERAPEWDGHTSEDVLERLQCGVAGFITNPSIPETTNQETQ